MPEIEFERRDAARQIRQTPEFRPFLSDGDDARTATVDLKDNTPDEVVDRITGEAAESREFQADKTGQVPLSDRERAQIDFTETSVPAARSAKGAAAAEGVDDFISFFDETLTVDENRELFKQANREEQGKRNVGSEREQNAKRLAQANKARKRDGGGRLKRFGLVDRDQDAQDELRDRGGAGQFDIAFSRDDRGGLLGQGEDFDRLEKRHQQRSERAQTLDEKQSAPVTRDPIAWTNNPAELDFPGIDTVEPNELHAQRSERAQEVDENELAPIAESKEEWAQNPEQFDFEGVDTPEDFDRDMSFEDAAEASFGINMSEGDGGFFK